MSTSVVDDDVASILGARGSWDGLAGTRVVVTGATGMVGQYATRVLLALQARLDPAPRVVALVRSAARARALFAGPLDDGSLELVVQDVADPFAVDGPVDWVVHAASPANPSAFRTDPVGVVRANVLGTMNALDLARSTGAAVCFTSTMEVYGSPPPGTEAGTGRGDRVLDEHGVGVLDTLDLRSAYPESKRVAETLCVAASEQFGTEHRIVRLSHTYGPGMDLHDSRVQAYFLRQALAGEDIALQSDGTTERTYTYIADATAAVFAILLAPGSAAYNVADDTARVSIRQLAETFLRHGRDPGATVTTTPRTGGALWSRNPGGTFLDCTRLRSLGWEPRVPLDEGVARTIAHSSGPPGSSIPSISSKGTRARGG